MLRLAITIKIMYTKFLKKRVISPLGLYGKVDLNCGENDRLNKTSLLV